MFKSELIERAMIPVADPYFDFEELENLNHAIKTGWISSKGEFISQFEESFARYCGVKYATSTSNGTTALHLALMAIGIKPGDEVIVPTLTFISPANAVSYCGATPVFVDSEEDSWSINPRKIEEAITKKTRAVIVVHLYGHPCNMDPIIKVVKKNNLYLVEDAAESHGALYKQNCVGSFGDVSCFSFFGNKNITSGEGGMCLTNNQSFFNKMNILKNHGMDANKKYWHTCIGYNYRITNMQAAVGLAQLKKLDRFLEKKKKIANWYREEFRDLIDKKIITPHPKMPWAQNVVWLYTILLNNKTEKERDEIINKLKTMGVETRPFFYPLHLMPPYKSNQKFPVAEKISAGGISLPSSVKLSREQVAYIADALRKIIKKDANN